MLDELRARLDELEVRSIVEYLAGRLHLTGDHSRVLFELEHGNLRRTELGHAQIGNVELERVAAVPYTARRPPVGVALAVVPAFPGRSFTWGISVSRSGEFRRALT